MLFDRELELAELLGSTEASKLQSLLAGLLGAPVQLLDAEGEQLVSTDEKINAQRVPLHWDLEIVAWLESTADEDRLKAAASLMERWFDNAARYHMTRAVHLEAVHDDYEKLQRQHLALQQSEVRYRDLSENLEQRVKEQVRTIETAQRKLYQAEKMAAVGQLAAGVAHEINNPIGFIKSNLNAAHKYVEDLQAFATALKQSSDSKQAQEYWQESELDGLLEDFIELLDESNNGTERVAAIVADMKITSDIDNSGEAVVDLNTTIRAISNIAANRFAERAELMLDLHELPLTRCYPGQLSQACLHLLLNAAEAVTPPGEIRISSRYEDNEICLRISDNGKGMQEEVLCRAFDPFYTTRDVGEGTGLGLTVCRDIVQAHEGRIEIMSEAGCGTTVSIYLPVRI